MTWTDASVWLVTLPEIDSDHIGRTVAHDGSDGPGEVRAVEVHPVTFHVTEPVGQATVVVVAGSGAAAATTGNNFATPPWCEQVPWRLSEKLYVPSRQRAVAPAGGCPLLV